jgi:hypothetical protein
MEIERHMPVLVLPRCVHNVDDMRFGAVALRSNEGV